MSCQPEKATGYVDDALEPEERLAVEAHLAECPDCRDQVAEERRIREALLRLPPIEPRAGFELALRSRLKRRSRPARWLLPLAAVLALTVLWLRGVPGVVAYEVAFDHAKCFRRDPLPAKVWSADRHLVTAWFEERGTAMPLIPGQAGGAELVGGRYCPLIGGSSAPHLYYSSELGAASLFVIPRSVRFTDEHESRLRGLAVRLLRHGGHTLAIVSDDRGLIDDLERSLTVSVARLR